MIRSTHAQNPSYVVSAYSDNAAVIEGFDKAYFLSPAHYTGEWTSSSEPVYHVIKVETQYVFSHQLLHESTLMMQH